MEKAKMYYDMLKKELDKLQMSVEEFMDKMAGGEEDMPSEEMGEAEPMEEKGPMMGSGMDKGKIALIVAKMKKRG